MELPNQEEGLSLKIDVEETMEIYGSTFLDLFSPPLSRKKEDLLKKQKETLKKIDFEKVIRLYELNKSQEVKIKELLLFYSKKESKLNIQFLNSSLAKENPTDMNIVKYNYEPLIKGIVEDLGKTKNILQNVKVNNYYSRNLVKKQMIINCDYIIRGHDQVWIIEDLYTIIKMAYEDTSFIDQHKSKECLKKNRQLVLGFLRERVEKQNMPELPDPIEKIIEEFALDCPFHR